MKEITQAGLFHTQVCSDEYPHTIIPWLNENEVSSAEWELATPSLMRRYAAGDPNPNLCDQNPQRLHYLFVVKGWFPDDDVYESSL